MDLFLRNIAGFLGKTKPKIVAVGAGLMLLLQQLGASETVVIIAGVLDGIALVAHTVTDIAHELAVGAGTGVRPFPSLRSSSASDPLGDAEAER
jgi:hypothetical protein